MLVRLTRPPPGEACLPRDDAQARRASSLVLGMRFIPGRGIYGRVDDRRHHEAHEVAPLTSLKERLTLATDPGRSGPAFSSNPPQEWIDQLRGTFEAQNAANKPRRFRPSA